MTQKLDSGVDESIHLLNVAFFELEILFQSVHVVVNLLFVVSDSPDDQLLLVRMVVGQAGDEEIQFLVVGQTLVESSVSRRFTGRLQADFEWYPVTSNDERTLAQTVSLDRLKAIGSLIVVRHVTAIVGHNIQVELIVDNAELLV